MIAAQFDYVAPSTIEEALAALAGTPGAMVIAGGQGMLGGLKSGEVRPSLVVDVRRVADLVGLSVEPDTVRIGALTTFAALAASQALPPAVLALSDAVRAVADPQVRNAATVGGSIALNEPTSDLTAPLLALSATVHVLGRGGRRSAAISDLLNGANRTSLKQGEIIVGVEIPTPGHCVSAYERFTSPAGGYALTGVAVGLRFSAAGAVSDCGVAVTGTERGAIRVNGVERALIGRALDDGAIHAAAAVMETESLPFASDLRGSADYRKELAGVLLERAVRAALARNAGSH